MEKLKIIENITPLLDRALSDVREKDILSKHVEINQALALFTQELCNCSLSGQVVINSTRYGELLMYSLHTSNYTIFSSVVDLLQWHMLEQSPHTGFLWAMTVLLERIHELKLFKKILDIALVNDALSEINNPIPPMKAQAKKKAPAAKPAVKKAKVATKKAPAKKAPAKKVAPKAKAAAKKAPAKKAAPTAKAVAKKAPAKKAAPKAKAKTK